MRKIFLLLAAAATLGACAGPQTEVINYRTITDPERGIGFVYDGVLDKAELISGVGGDQKRVYVTREGSN